jgi:hypothetical protein
MNIESVLCVVVMVSMVAAFFILLAKKLGIVEWMQIHGDKFISQMASCDFCMSFWAGTLLFICAACFFRDPIFLFGGIASCPITRMLL